MKKILDRSGIRYGRLIAIELHGKNSSNKYTWKCQCDCGNDAIVTGNDLTTGHTQSCGCLFNDVAESSDNKHKVHGKSKTPEFRAWSAIKTRCLNSKSQQYSRYGGRGIKISDSWLNSFENFIDDMGKRPSAKHSIERIKNDGDYCKENCRWATAKEQANNRRNNKLLTVNGMTKTMSEMADYFGIVDRNTIGDRLDRGWTHERAVLTEVGGNRT